MRQSLRYHSLATLARMCVQAIHLRLSLRSNSVRTAPPPYGRGAVRPLGAPPSLRAAPAPPRRFAPTGLALAPRPVLGAPLAPAVPRGRPRAYGACGVRWAPSVAAGVGACCPLPRPPPCRGRVAPPFPPILRFLTFTGSGCPCATATQPNPHPLPLPPRTPRGGFQ